MSPTLATALREAGFPFAVEVRDRLLILLPSDPEVGQPPPTREERRRILAIARQHGFTHVALELTSADDAAVLRHQS